MNNIGSSPSGLSISQRLILGSLLLVVLLLSSCSSGLRLKNLANIPLDLADLTALDTMTIQPDIVRYTGVGETDFRVFNADITIQGNHRDRPLWESRAEGCFRVTNGARVHILDFNFKGIESEIASVKVDSGIVILENCDFFEGDAWMIEVGPAGILEIHAALFRDLGQGAIILKGGRVRIYNSRFINAGETPIYSESGILLEAHHVNIINAMANGITLASVSEVWLDTVTVSKSFQDGVSLENCDYAFISDVNLKENGRHGLRANGGSILGLLRVKSMGNLLNGLELSNVDSLRIMGSEMVYNGANGTQMSEVTHMRLANVHLGYNAQSGLMVQGGSEFMLEKSLIQGNPEFGCSINATQKIQVHANQVLNNATGMLIADYDSLSLKENLFVLNRKLAQQTVDGDRLITSRNVYRENGVGVSIQNVLNVQFDSCRVEANELGTDFRSVSQLSMNNNSWIGNSSSSYFSDMGDVQSKNDSWIRSKNSGVEVLSADEIVIINAKFNKNHNDMLFNQASVRLENCTVDSSTGFAVKGLSSLLSLLNPRFDNSETAMVFSDGSRCEVIQGKFNTNTEFMVADGSTDLLISYCTINKARKGISLGAFSKLELVSSSFSEIDGYCINIKDPQIQSVLLRQNIMHHSGGILKSPGNSGEIIIVNNTFADLLSGFALAGGKMTRFDQNILWKVAGDPANLFQKGSNPRWNCFEPGLKPKESQPWSELNLFADPDFEAEYYLSPRSPCIRGGENGTLIGALGIVPIIRPDLKP